jgi:hypothetical protein
VYLPMACALLVVVRVDLHVGVKCTDDVSKGDRKVRSSQAQFFPET